MFLAHEWTARVVSVSELYNAAVAAATGVCVCVSVFLSVADILDNITSLQ